MTQAVSWWTLDGLYHLIPVDAKHRQYGLVVGDDDSVVAEMFRSDVSILTKRLGFEATHSPA
jgi:hypothetical protein